MFKAIAFLAVVLIPGASETVPDQELHQFSVAVTCLRSCGRSPSAEYQVLIDAEQNQLAYWVGRDRGTRIEYVHRLEMARNAWYALEMIQQPNCFFDYWLGELRCALGDDAFRAGAMPPFPWVRVFAFTEH